MKPILVINSGSSSLKYQLIDISSEQSLIAGLIERVTDHRKAFDQMLEELRVANAPSPVAVGHRVVHGGANFSQPTLVTDQVLKDIKELSSLAPLHNPGNASGIEAARQVFSDLPQVVVFDTAFHQTMPESAFTYAINRELAEKFGVRRYGFHGTSHSYVAKKTAMFLDKPLDQLNAIILHLGNGASACAIRGGKSIDTSMGLTPLQGLVMGTRSGDIDPAIVMYLSRVAGLSLSEIDDSLNRNAGLKGMTGDSDLRDVEHRAAAGDSLALNALEVYAHRIRHYIGAYLAQIGPLDALVFTAGVGENSARMRALSGSNLEHIGISIDPEKNATRSKDARSISTEASKVQVLVIPTNEELEIALQTESFI